jgi:hypothetical protein
MNTKKLLEAANLERLSARYDHETGFVFLERDPEGGITMYAEAMAVLSAISGMYRELEAPGYGASVPTFPCESCGAFHSASEVAETGGYCPRCDADYDERKMFDDLVTRYTALAAAPRPGAQDGWIPVSERLPDGERTVLAFYLNSHGKECRVRAEYIEAKTKSAGDGSWDSDSTADYDEQTDEYFWPAGWYEVVDNWDELTHIAIHEGEVTQWTHLPAAPDMK